MGVIGTLAVNVVANTGGLSTGVQHARQELHELGHTAREIATELTGLAGGFLGAAGGAIGAALAWGAMSERAKEFEEAMQRSVAVMGGVTGELREHMEQAAHQVAYSTKFSATEAAAAYADLARSGMDAEQSIAALPIVAYAAQASLQGMGETARELTTILNGLGLANKDAAINAAQMARISDVLTVASQKGNGTMKEFTDALSGKTLGAIRGVGMSVEEATAALMVFSLQGLKGGDAGQSLTVVLRELKKHAVDNAQAFQNAGVSVFEASGKMRNLVDIADDLDRSLAKLSQEGKVGQMLELKLSPKSWSAFGALAGQAEKIREFKAELDEAEGATEKLANESLTDLDRGLNRVKAAFGNLSSTMAEGEFKRFGTAVLWVTETLSGLEDPVGQVIIKMAAFTGVFFGALAVLPKIISGIKLVVTAIRSWAGAQALLNAMINPVYMLGALAAGAAAVWAINAAFDGLDAKQAAAEAKVSAAAAKAAALAKMQKDFEGEEARLKDQAEAFKTAHQEAERAAKRLADEGKRVTDSLRTPAEVMADTMAHLNSLVEQGAITWDTYRRGVVKANDELAKAAEHNHSHASNPALVQGTTAAFNAVNQSRDEMARAARVQQQQLDAQKQANDFLKKIADQTKRDPVEIKNASI